MSTELTAEQRADWEATMHFVMSAYSEAATCAQWDTLLTPTLIALCEEVKKTGEPARRGTFYLTPADASLLQFMADKLGYWWDYNKPYDPANYIEDDAPMSNGTLDLD